MADWLNNPNLQQTYSAFVSSIRARDVDTAKMFNGTGTNPPDEAVRWNSGADVFQVYSSTTAAWTAISPGLESLVVASAPNSRALIKVDVYTADDTWTRPDGCTAVEVWCIGAGGGGGSAACVSGNVQVAAAGGGGGGSFSYAFEESGINSTASVEVGAVGARGTAGGDGSAGGDTWFQSTLFVKSNGGDGGDGAKASATKRIVLGGGGPGGAGGAYGDVTGNGGIGGFGGYTEYTTASAIGITGGIGGSSGMFSVPTGRVGGLSLTYLIHNNITGVGLNGYDTTFGGGYGAGGQGGSAYYGTDGAGGNAVGGYGGYGLVIVKSYT